jgi:hypothetical protein
LIVFFTFFTNLRKINLLCFRIDTSFNKDFDKFEKTKITNMKKTNKIILTALFSIISVAISAQKFKQFEFMDEPFKTFKSPVFKFDSTSIASNRNYFQRNESQVFTRNNGMPILNTIGFDDKMLIYVPDSNIKQSLIIENPKGFEIPKNK